jgi:hypothetical protein
MPLTRHFYELDEVVSAAETNLRNGWPRTLFWIWELLASDEHEVARTLLLTSWLNWGAPYDPALAALLTKPIRPDDADSWIAITTRVGEACRKTKTLTVMRFINETAALLCRPAVTPVARRPVVQRRRIARSMAFVSTLSESEDIDFKDAGNFWISLDSACRQGSRTNAVWILQAAQHVLSADAIWSALRIASRGGAATAAAIAGFQAAASPHPVQQLQFQAAAALLLCIGTTERTEMLAATVPSIQLQKRSWDEWAALMGRRKARINAIPAEALHKETTRGAMPSKYTNIGDVREPVALLVEGCKWWRDRTRSYGIVEDEETGAVIFPDDDVLERFYDDSFPDDIPDEWSKVDQEKSHGRGCLETAVAPLTLLIREEPVSRRRWFAAIHVPSNRRK